MIMNKNMMMMVMMIMIYDYTDDEDDAHPIVSYHKPELERPETSGKGDSPMLNTRFILCEVAIHFWGMQVWTQTVSYRDSQLEKQRLSVIQETTQTHLLSSMALFLKLF